MAEITELLLASDFSPRSDRPLERAATLAAERGARLVIAHVLERENAKAGEDVVDRLRADLPALAVGAEIVVRAGSVPTTLAEIAAERGSDLIVTGVARYNSLGDFLLGTAVDHIVRNADVPVLVVRLRADRRYDRIVVATDFSDCSRAALLAAARLFPDAKLHVVHAFHVPYEGWLKSEGVQKDLSQGAEQAMADFLDHPDVDAGLRGRITPVTAEGATEIVVSGQLRETKANLLVLGTHGRSGFAHATIGSQAEAMLDCVDTDVLMVRERKQAAR